MSDETAHKEATEAKAKPSVTKTARVSVLKVITYGDHKCAPGHVIQNMDLDEVKIRVDSGEVKLIKVN